MSGNIKHTFWSVRQAFNFCESKEPKGPYDDEGPSSTRKDKWGGGFSFDGFEEAVFTKPQRFTNQTEEILNVTKAILADLPYKNMKTKVRKPAYTGGRVNVRKVLSGNHSQSRNKWQRKFTKKIPKFCAIILNTCFPHYVNTETIMHTTAAPIALAYYLETEHGVAVDIWSQQYYIRPYSGRGDQGMKDAEFYIRIKAPNKMAILEDIAPILSPAWLRKLHFRFIEVTGKPNGGYGRTADSEVMVDHAFTFADEHHLNGHLVTPFGGISNNLNDTKDAIKWIEKQLKILEIIG